MGLGIGLGIGIGRRRGGGVIATGSGQVFNGTDQYAYVADNGALDIAAAVAAGATDFCFGGFIKTGSDITTTQHCIGKGTRAAIAGRYSIFIATNTMYIYRQTSTGYLSLADQIVLAVNTEYHIMIRFDLTNSKLYYYIDNVLQYAGGSDFTGTFPAMANDYVFNLATENDTGGGGNYLPFSGRLRDVRVYHKDVTSGIPDWILGKQLGGEIAWWDLPSLSGIGGTSFNLTAVNF